MSGKNPRILAKCQKVIKISGDFYKRSKARTILFLILPIPASPFCIYESIAIYFAKGCYRTLWAKDWNVYEFREIIRYLSIRSLT